MKLGDVRGAAALLGHPWSLTGPVIHGAKLGRQLGYPTANLAVDPACRLKHAIYAVEVAVDWPQRLKGVASFGRRPTVDNGPPLLEVYIFDFAGDIYGKEIEVFFIDFLRPEQKFDSLDAIGRANPARRNRGAGKTRRVTPQNGASFGCFSRKLSQFFRLIVSAHERFVPLSFPA